MEQLKIEAMARGCLRYIQAMELPVPLPESVAEYGAWRERVAGVPDVDDEAEECWFDLDRMASESPNDAWEVIRVLSRGCTTEDQAMTLAAGPLETFLRKYRAAFSEQIEEERANDAGFRAAIDAVQ